MAAFIAFIVILFAPSVGVEPGFIDDAASRVILEPKWVPIGAILFAAVVELAFLFDLHRERTRVFLEVIRSGFATYLGTGLVAAVVWLVLGSPLLADVTVSRGGRMTAAAWSILGAIALVLLVGGTFFGALFWRWLGARSGSYRATLRTVAAENAVSLVALGCGLLFLSKMR